LATFDGCFLAFLALLAAFFAIVLIPFFVAG
jgi:hypothetical protein